MHDSPWKYQMKGGMLLFFLICIQQCLFHVQSQCQSVRFVSLFECVYVHVCVFVCDYTGVKVIVLSGLKMPSGLSVLLTHSKVIWLAKTRYSSLPLSACFFHFSSSLFPFLLPFHCHGFLFPVLTLSVMLHTTCT